MSADELASSEHSERVLLEAVIAMSSDLDLPAVLERIVVSAVEMTDARYGALGVVGPGGVLSEFITTGVDDDEREAIGDPPHGGVLAMRVDDPATVEEFVNEDPYHKAGLVRSWRVEPWNVVT